MQAFDEQYTVDEPPDEGGPEPAALVGSWTLSHSSALYRRAYWILRDREAAQDCVQRTFERACREGRKILDVDNPQAWLYTVTSNLALNMVRDRSRKDAVLRRLHVQESTPDTDEATLRRVAVAEALDKLPDELRTLVMLRYYDGLTDGEIARTTGLNVGTVKSRLFRARKDLARSSALAGWIGREPGS